MDITTLYKTQISLTEWFEEFGYENASEFRKEDNEKRTRLEILNQVLGLPFDRPHQFPAEALKNNSPDFAEFIKEHAHELCALRLIPNNHALPKLRMRGHTMEQAMVWFREQTIDATMYKADFVPHLEHNEWSTIFIVNKLGIFGEIIQGGHHQLTQGFYDEEKPLTFSFVFDGQGALTSQTTLPSLAREEIESILSWIKVTDTEKQSILQDRLQSVFYNDYLGGYFETVSSKEFGIWYIDYNRILGDLYKDFKISQSPTVTDTSAVIGQIGNGGKVVGKVRVAHSVESEITSIDEGDILVCPMTTPEFIPLMKRAGAFVTDLGGILCHAAIVAREMKKPCIIGTKFATQVLKDGDLVEVDADRGIVTILDRKA